MQKKHVVYLHRCPIEYEAKQYPGLKDLFNELLKKYRVTYLSMKGPYPKDQEIRKKIKIESMPGCIDSSKGKDKLLKTALWYLLLPLTLSKLKKLKPDFIISKESLPFIPSVIGRLGIPMIIDVEDWWWTIFFGTTKIGDKLAYFLEGLEIRDWKKFKSIVVIHSQTDAKIINKHSMPAKRIKVVNFPAYETCYFPCKADDVREKLNLTISLEK